MILLALLGLGASAASGYDPFVEYEHADEVPVVGRAEPKGSRHGPVPPRPLVRLATHYLRISEDPSDVSCHRVRGYLIACRAHLNEWVAARLLIHPSGRNRDFIIRCETLRSLRPGPVSDAACFDFTVWEFDQWMAGPPSV